MDTFFKGNKKHVLKSMLYNIMVHMHLGEKIVRRLYNSLKRYYVFLCNLVLIC